MTINQLIAISEEEWYPVYTFTTNLEGERMTVTISSEKLVELKEVMSKFNEMQSYLHKLLYYNKL